jgi:hypothetical protein
MVATWRRHGRSAQVNSGLPLPPLDGHGTHPADTVEQTHDKAGVVFLVLPISRCCSGSHCLHARTDARTRARAQVLIVSTFYSCRFLSMLLLEKPILLREQLYASYPPAAYYFAKIGAQFLPQTLVFHCIFVALAYPFIGLRADFGHLAQFWGVLVLYSLTFANLCFVVALLAPAYRLAQWVVAIITLISLVFGGFFVRSHMIPVYLKWVPWLSPSFKAYQAIMVSQLQGVQLYFNPMGNYPLPYSGEAYLDKMRLSTSSIAVPLGVLGAMAFIYGAGALGILVGGAYNAHESKVARKIEELALRFGPTRTLMLESGWSFDPSRNAQSVDLQREVVDLQH